MRSALVARDLRDRLINGLGHRFILPVDPNDLRRCYETADFAPLLGWYAEEALFDALVPGRRVTLKGPDAIVAQLTAWWPEPGAVLRWNVEEFPTGLTVELERETGDEVWRQRHFFQLEGKRIVREQAYSARPQARAKSDVEAPLPPGLDVVAREPLTHPGQSGNRLERVRLRDGTALVLKHLVPGGDWIAQGTKDEGRELTFFEHGVFARLPPTVDHAVVSAYDRTLVLRDVSAELVSPSHRWTRAESQRILEAAAAMHRTFAGESVPAAAALEDRLRFCGVEAIRPWAAGEDLIPKVIFVGWEVFAEAVAPDVVDAVFAVHAAPERLARELSDGTTTLIHGDLRWANLGMTEDRVVMLDWGIATAAPAALDFPWYLLLNGRRIDATYDELIDDFREAEGDLVDDRTLDLAWLGQLCVHGGLLAHELLESDAEKRELARTELEWWSNAARRALRHFAPA